MIVKKVLVKSNVGAIYFGAIESLGEHGISLTEAVEILNNGSISLAIIANGISASNSRLILLPPPSCVHLKWDEIIECSDEVIKYFENRISAQESTDEF